MAEAKPSRRRQGGPVCSAFHCSNAFYSNDNKGWSFFRFPRDKERCRIWIQNSRRDDLLGVPTEKLSKSNYTLCSIHFEASQFTVPSEKKRLNWNAVPTIFHVPTVPPKSKRVHKPQSLLKEPARKRMKMKNDNEVGKRERKEEQENQVMSNEFCEIKQEIDKADTPSTIDKNEGTSPLRHDFHGIKSERDVQVDTGSLVSNTCGDIKIEKDCNDDYESSDLQPMTSDRIQNQDVSDLVREIKQERLDNSDEEYAGLTTYTDPNLLISREMQTQTEICDSPEPMASDRRLSQDVFDQVREIKQERLDDSDEEYAGLKTYTDPNLLTSHEMQTQTEICHSPEQPNDHHNCIQVTSVRSLKDCEDHLEKGSTSSFTVADDKERKSEEDYNREQRTSRGCIHVSSEDQSLKNTSHWKDVLQCPIEDLHENHSS